MKILSRGEQIFFYSLILLHVFLIWLLDDVFALAPDEERYLYTFDHLYQNYFNSNPQYESGWVAAPKLFLYVALFPAKILASFGVPNLIAIRLESMALISIILWICLSYLGRQVKFRGAWFRFCILGFSIPSILLWTSLGLRESFLMFFLFVFLVGLMSYQSSPSWKNGLILFSSSYSLISTKNYQWLLLVLSLGTFTLIKIRSWRSFNFNTKLFLISVFGPLLLFVMTTGSDSLDFVLRQNISSVSDRSGESVTTLTGEDLAIIKDVPLEESDPKTNEESDSSVAIQGSGTLIQLSMLSKSENNLQKVLNLLGLEILIKNSLKSELSNENNRDGLIIGVQDKSNVLKPGKLSTPTSLIGPGLRYLIGPFPTGHFSILQIITLYESIIWILLFLITLLHIFNKIRLKAIIDNSCFYVASIFIMGNIIFSSLVEVNVGTAFRHRSILLVPLLIINFVILSQKQKSDQSR